MARALLRTERHGISREGAVAAREMAAALADETPTLVLHSGLARTERLARMVGAPVRADPRWRERDFGSWEGRRWDAIWRETGDLMDRMVTHPASFRPGGGETTAAVMARAAAAWRDLPAGGTIAVIAHGGPIAAVRAMLAGASVGEMVSLIPRCGEVIRIAR